MSDPPTDLLLLVAGGIVGTALLAVALVKTVRYHGWGKQTWAPPAVPWFIAGLAVLVVTLAAVLVGFLSR